MKGFRVRLDDDLDRVLEFLESERYVNVGAWVRSLLRAGLTQQRWVRLRGGAPPGNSNYEISAASELESLQARRWLLGIFLPWRCRQAPRGPGQVLHRDYAPAGRLLDRHRVRRHRAPGDFVLVRDSGKPSDAA